jgi:hypothetical protein
MVPGTPVAAPGPGIDSHWDNDNSQHFNFLTDGNRGFELYIHLGAPWTVHDLNAQGGNNIPIPWKLGGLPSECGQRTVLISHENPKGSVELWYRMGVESALPEKRVDCSRKFQFSCFSSHASILMFQFIIY